MYVQFKMLNVYVECPMLLKKERILKNDSLFGAPETKLHAKREKGKQRFYISLFLF